jgi:hypothetical protein
MLVPDPSVRKERRAIVAAEGSKGEVVVDGFRLWAEGWRNCQTQRYGDTKSQKVGASRGHSTNIHWRAFAKCHWL